MTDEIRAQLAPHGVLRAGINMSNFLLVTSRTPEGDPEGVSPGMARAVAAALGVPVKLVPFPRPGELADAVDADAWDIGLIGAEPQRAEKIAFTAPYAVIEATYMLPPGSPIAGMEQVDQAGVRIAVAARSAYDLWLARNIHRATLVRGESLDEATRIFMEQKLEALAGLRPRLITDAEAMPGARILEGNFTTVQQAIGTAKRNAAAAEWLARFVEEAKASGLVGRLIAQHEVRGLSVAPLA